MLPAPIAGEARKQAESPGPGQRISLAKTGSSATAPPSSTANRSSEIEPRMTFFRRCSGAPPARVFRLSGFPARGLARKLDFQP